MIINRNLRDIFALDRRFLGCHMTATLNVISLTI